MESGKSGAVRRRYLKILAVVAAIAAAAFFQYRWNVAAIFSPGRIERWLDGAGVLAPLVLMGAMAVAIVVSPIPSLPLSVAAGAFFGPLLGTLYSVIGASAGAAASFLLARMLGREFVERFLGERLRICSRCSDRVLTKVVFISRLVPMVSFDVVSYGAGLTNMSLKKFLLATFLGMIPMTFLYNSSGSVLVFGNRVTFVLGAAMVVFLFLAPKWLGTRGIFKQIGQKISKDR